MSDEPQPGGPGCVLFVHQSSDLYGSDRVLLEAATALQRRGGLPIVVLPSGGPLVEALRARGIEACPLAPGLLLKLQRRAASPAAVWGLLRALPRALAALDACVAGRHIDLVQSNTLAVLVGALWARRRGTPHLWHVHEIIEQPALAAWALPWLLRLLADRVVCNSHATRRWLLAAQPALAQRTEVVWNGTDKPAPSADPRRAQDCAARFRPDGQSLALGLVGRINQSKGHALLLQATELLAAQGVVDFSLVFVGSPAPGKAGDLAALRQRIAASPVAHRVQLFDFADDTASVYQALDIVCVPSFESFGLVIIEAMACARPVVAANAGGIPEIVVDGVTGLLHQPGDAQSLAEQLAVLINDPARRAALGQAGRDRCENSFGLERMVGHLQDSQRRCIAQAPRRPVDVLQSQPR
jgi:glycosyltransferase involved in cell wall biosynthesis